MSVKIVQPLGPVHSYDGAAFPNFTAFQDISPQPLLLIPQQDMEVDLRVRLEAWGEFSTTGTPTLSIGFWFNTAATVLAQYTAVATGSAAASWPWVAYYLGTLRVAGPGSTGGTWNGQGYVDVGASLTSFAARQPIPSTLALRTVTADVTAARAVGVGAAWGTSSASNSIKVNNFSCELLTGL